MAKDESIKLSLIDGVSKNLQAIRESVDGVGASLVKLNQAGELAGKVLGGLQSIAGFFGDLVQDAGNYELALAQVEQRTQATAAESKLLRDAVQQALQETATSGAAAAQALRLLAEDGASATEAAQNLGEVLAFAQANTRGVAETVQGLGAVLDAFGAAPDKIGALADSLTATAIAAGTSTQAIEKGLAGVGVAADQAGLSINETTALIGALAERGIEGGRAAGVLTKILQDMQNPASKAGEALRQAGVDTTDLSGVMELLAKDAGLAEKVLAGLGNKPRAALKLLLQDGGASIAKLTEIIQGSAGASQKASDELGKNYTLAMQRLQAAVEQARNTFLEPILDPLAKSFNDFATRINTFAQSEDFKAIAQKITGFVDEGLRAFEQFVQDIDLEEATTKVRAFADSTVEILAEVRQVFSTTLVAAGNFGDGLGAAFNASVAAVSASLSSVLGALGTFSDTAEEVSVSLAAIADEARDDVGEAIGRIAKRMEESGKAAGESARKIDDAARATGGLGEKMVSAVPPLNAFGKSLEDTLASATSLPPAFDMVAKAMARMDAAQRDLNKAMTVATIATYEAQLGKLVRAQAELFNSGQANSAEFRRLSQEVSAAEGKIAALREAQNKLAGATEKTAETTAAATDEIVKFGSASAAAAQAGDRLSNSNSQVSESFGNIGRNASAVEVSLGNLTEAMTQQVLAAAGTAKSARDYIDTLNRGFNAAADEEERIQRRIDLLERSNKLADEDVRLRKQLEAQYGTSSTQLEKLMELEKQRLVQRRQSVDLDREELKIEQQRAAVRAGAFNTSQGTPEPTPGATGGRGSGGTGGRGPAAAPVINVTVNGLPNDRDSWRSLVQERIVPELDRIARLSR